MLKVLDLFSGIGGFSLGLEQTGHFKTVAFCEIDKYCRQILEKHWKKVKIYNDVKEITKERLQADGIDPPAVITGGFPCQPFSVAGNQKGTSDNRYLWPEMFRIIQELTPRWVVGENVKGITNIQDGMVFETVCTDLEGEGYEVRAFNIPAAGVGAPHRRERLWIVAHSKFNGLSSSQKPDSIKKTISKESHGENNSFNTTGTSGLSTSKQIMENSRRTIRGEQSTRNKESIGSGTSEKTEWSANSDSFARSSKRKKIMANPNINREKWNQSEDGQRSGAQQSSEDVANTSKIRSSSESIRNSTSLEKKSQRKKEEGNQSTIRTSAGNTDGANTESIRSREFGHSNHTQGREGSRSTQFDSGSSTQRKQGWLNIEPNVGRVAHGISGRVHRLKGLGNSIIPKIAEELGKAIYKATIDGK